MPPSPVPARLGHRRVLVADSPGHDLEQRGEPGRGQRWWVVRGSLRAQVGKMLVVAPRNQVPHDVPTQLVWCGPHAREESPLVDQGVVALAQQGSVVKV